MTHAIGIERAAKVVERLDAFAEDLMPVADVYGDEMMLLAEAASLITTLVAENERLARERDDIQQESWGLQAKVAALSAHESCACSWDSPDDICSHHSPKLLASERQLATAREALNNIRELNFSGADENGNQWANSDLIDQEITAAVAALTPGVGEC